MTNLIRERKAQKLATEKELDNLTEDTPEKFPTLFYEEQKGKITAVCNVTAKDVSRFKVLLLKSLDKFFDANSLEELIIVAPDKEFDIVNNDLQKEPSKHKLSAIAETTLVAPMDRWIFTQLSTVEKARIVKLFVSQNVKTKFYITFDPDTICSNYVTYNSLIHDEKALLSTENKDVHPKWWEKSGSVLGVKANTCTTGLIGSPCIYNTGMVRQLLVFLKEKYAQNALRTLAVNTGINENEWREHAIYYTYLEMRQKTDEFYAVEKGPLVAKNPDTNIWVSDQFEYWRPENVFLKSPGYFCTVQNRAVPNLKEVYDKIKKYLD